MLTCLLVVAISCSAYAQDNNWLELRLPEFAPKNASFSPDGKLVAIGGRSDQGVKVYLAGVFDVATGKLFHEMEFPSRNSLGNDSHVSFGDGSDLLFIGTANVTDIWDLTKNKSILQYRPPGLKTPIYSTKNHFVTSLEGLGVTIREIGSGEVVCKIKSSNSFSHHHEFISDTHLLIWPGNESQLELWSLNPSKKLHAIGTARYKLVAWQLLPGEEEVALLYQTQDEWLLAVYQCMTGREVRSERYPRGEQTYGNLSYRQQRMWFTRGGDYLLSVRYSPQLRGHESALIRLSDLKLMNQPFRNNDDLKKDENFMGAKRTLSLVRAAGELLFTADEFEHNRAQGSYQPSGAVLTRLYPFGERKSVSVVQPRVLNQRFRPTELVGSPDGKHVVVLGHRQRWELRAGGNRLNFRDYENFTDETAYLVQLE
ncbi:WD40 repeat domain-containing protein [Calycomorphotria hydatis]|uniref:WD40 repeat domain-containing protein n=1 Tax=Calycomorphotria hydatis TaxID=2528027 RepID=UPI0011A92463|nr:WD40 repeat domain-containing protein [Calycomorphotria hydatis]